MQEGPERIDYHETPDVTEVHAAVKREHRDPGADVTPIPLWLAVVCAIAVAWAGAYLGVFHGGFSANVFDENKSSPVLLFPSPLKAGAGSADAGAQQTLAQIGKSVYGNCQTCHQPTGAGIPNQFPPLAGSSWVNGSEKRVVAILLKGIQGPITVEGKTFNGAMPAWEKTLSDKKIAGAASYIRSEFGNKSPEISEAKVAAARKEFAAQVAPWTEAELKQIPEDATLPDAAGAPAPTAPAGAPAAAPAPAPAPAAGAPAAGGGASDLAGSIERGKLVYMQTCVACHQPNGLGLPGAFPPLAGTEYTQGDVRRMIAMTLKGVNPPLKVKELTYVVPMPPLPTQFPVLTDDLKLADVINYVRNSFGNKDEKTVTPAIIDAVRKEFTDRANPWTEAELQNFPPAAK